MYEELQKVKQEVKDLKKEITTLKETVHKLSETSYKTAKREIINREVQFLQKVYRANGTLVTEINP